MKRFLRNYLDDILLILGCGCILIGLAQWNAVIAWIVAGLMLIGFGFWYEFLIGKARRRDVD
jgi:hypothetical protein